MKPLDIGVLGLGVMGRNLALNMEEKGFSVARWDAWPEPVDSFVAARAQAQTVAGFKDARSFVQSLRRPRRIILLVKAGEVVDKTIAALRPLLEPGDILVDGGNEYYQQHRAPREASSTPRASATSAWACPAAKKARATARR